MKFWIAGMLGFALSIAVRAQAPTVKHPLGAYATINGAKL
jgi:hypothetical protein